ncbi:MAG: ABC transporter ATP-binding protein [Rhodospirillales bacterium]
MGGISLENVTKSFGEHTVISSFSLDIKDGEFAVFVGPSGCGKSTLLRLIAGLEDVSSGKITIDGKDATHVQPSHRKLAMVFQSYALYPHMTVRKNIAFPLKMSGLGPEETARKVEDAAKALNLTDYLDRRPGQLSGGQRQRVAIGRAIVREPTAFLFDEPLSNLDASLRVNMRLEISELHQSLGATMVYVTHDQVEAMTMADKIVVLNEGRIEQAGSPLELYRNPDNLFVAGFIGSPKMNILTGPHAQKHGAYTIGVRPEHMNLSKDSGVWEGTVGVAEHLGSDTFFHVTADAAADGGADGGAHLTVRTEGGAPFSRGDRVFVSPKEGFIHRFDESGKALR